jgi:ribosomal protein S18 acetylase RimI-like enzyme
MTPPDARGSVESATLADVDPLVDLWVALARDQRAYDSHLAPEANRTRVRGAIARHVVTDGVRLVRDDGDGDGDERDGDDGDGGDLLGFVMFGLEQGDYEQTITRGVVHNLYVVASARGRGLGSALLRAAETALARAGADVVSLEAMADNADARRFYERHGYRSHRVELEKPARSDTHSKEDG